jgi:hypothetical protein
MTKPYKHKITKANLKHLRDYGMTSMRLIEKTMKTQAKERKCTIHEPCWECKEIAKKLGLPV